MGNVKFGHLSNPHACSTMEAMKVNYFQRYIWNARRKKKEKGVAKHQTLKIMQYLTIHQSSVLDLVKNMF